MASFDTDIYTSENGTAGQSPAFGYELSKFAGGKLRYKVIQYVVDGAETTADTINLCKMKAGAVVIPSLSRVITGTGLDVNDLNIGVSGNDNKYADAMDTLDTASDIAFSGGDNHTAYTAVASGGETIIATLVAVTTSTASSTAVFLIAYVDE